MRYLYLITIFLSGYSFNAQNVAINTSVPDPSAILDIRHLSGVKQGVTMPKVFLSSLTDKTVINGTAPANGLILFNTNASMPSGKGLYYWSEAQQKWSFFVNQNSIELFKDLTRYYTKKSDLQVIVNYASYNASPYSQSELISARSWTQLPALQMSIEIDKPINTANIVFAGTWFAVNMNNTAIERNAEVGYGIFIDDKLVSTHIESKLFLNSCNVYPFYMNSVVENLTVGTHVVKFAVIVRYISAYTGGATFPNNTQLLIGGGNSNSVCRNTSAFESRSKATVHINQDF